jgi:hypothetical protein
VKIGPPPWKKAHPLALRLFEALEGEAEGDRRAVYDAVRTRLAGELPQDHLEIANALRACADYLGIAEDSVPEARYAEWRRDTEQLLAPSPSVIRRAGHGSWERGRAVTLGLPVSDPLHRRRFGARKPYHREEILAAIRSFAADTPAGEYPSSERYRRWAIRASAEMTVSERIPLTALPMVRAFDSWGGALDAAGVMMAAPVRLQTAAPRRFSRDDLVHALRAAARELGPPLTRARYDELVSRKRGGTSEEGPRAALPTSSSIAQRLGGWRHGVRAVLGPTFPVGRGRGVEFLDDDLARAWTGFVRYAGDRITVQMWGAYRESTRDDAGGHSVPSSALLLRRLGKGSWSDVCRHFGCEPLRPGRRCDLWTDEQLMVNWAACKEALNEAPNCRNHYEAWRERRRALAEGRLPPSSTVLMRRLGNDSWRELYSRLEGKPPMDGRRNRRRFTRKQLQAAWFEARHCLGGPPSIAGYTGYRERLIGEQSARAVPPHPNTLLRRFGSWRELHRQMEGMDPPPRSVRRSHAELVALIRQCAADIGRQPSIVAYRAWRAAQSTQGAVPLPKETTIACRLGKGSWTEAVRRALENTSGDDE